MRNKLVAVACVAGGLCLSPGPASAEGESTPNLDLPGLQAMSLEELLNLEVQTSSRRVERIEDAPNTVYVVTQDQIRRRGYHTLLEVLRTVPGFGAFHKDIQYVTQVRGIAPNDNEKIALLINGHNISNVVEPDWVNGPIDLSIAEKIEVVVGPGSVLYGTDALLATINIITRLPTKNEVNIAAGNVITEGTGVFGLKRSDDVYVVATATGMAKNGWDAWDKENHDGAVLAGTENTGKLDPSYFLTVHGQVGEWSIQGISLNDTFPDR